MPTTEQEPLSEAVAVRAMRAAKAAPTPERVQKARAIRDAWTTQAEQLGRDPWADTRRAQQQEEDSLRRLFQDRQTHGLDPETLGRIDRTLGATGNRYEAFNEQFAIRALKIPKDVARTARKDILRDYSAKAWGEEIEDDAAFAAKLGEQFDLEDRVSAAAAKAATGAGVRAAAPLEALAELDGAERGNPIYASRSNEYREQFTRVASAASRRLAPHRETVAVVSGMLKERMGVAEGDVTDLDPENYRDLARRIMAVPKEDRNLVLSAIRATAGENAKDVMQKLVESFARGLEDYAEGIPSQMDRAGLTALRAQVSAGLTVPEGSETDAGAYLAAASARFVERGDPTGTATLSEGLDRLIAGTPLRAPAETVRAQALARIDEAIEAVDMRGRLRQIAEQDLDPVTSDSFAMRGLYAAARSVPYTLVAMAPGGMLLNSAAMSEQSYQQLRAANPEMDASTAQGIAMVAGPVMGALENVSAKVLTGRLPSFNRWSKQPILTGGAAASRFGTRLAGAAGIEMVQENVQDLTPALIQGALSSLSEDVPGVDWSGRFGEMAANQGELFFAVLPLALIGAGVGTLRDYRGSHALLQSAEMLRAVGVSEADAAEIRAKAIAGDLSGAESALRQSFQTTGRDQQEIAATIAEAVPKVLAERDRLRTALAAGQDIDLLPAIENLGADGYALHFNDGSGMTFRSYGEAANRMEQIGRESVLQLHEDTVQTIRRVSSGIEAGRGLRYLFNPAAPTVEDAAAEGLITGEEVAQVGEIADTLTADTAREFAAATVQAEISSPNTESAAAARRIIGSSANEFRDGVLWTTMRFYQGFTPETVLEEKFEGDAKFLIDNLGMRKWMVGAFREWERVTGDRLLTTEDDTKVTNRNLVEAWGAMGRAWFIGPGAEGAQGKGLTRAKMEKLLSTSLAGSLTGYAAGFQATLRRSALVEQAIADGTLERRDLAGIADLLGRYSGISEQESFDRAVVREGETVAEEMGATFSTLSPGGESATNRPISSDSSASGENIAPGSQADIEARDAAYLDAIERGDMETAQKMAEAASDSLPFSIKPPGKLYRGVMDSGDGAGTYSLGKGLYTSPDKNWLSGGLFSFDEIKEIPAIVAFPRNPLQLRDPSQFSDWALRESGERNIRRFNEKYPDPGEFVKERGFDGIVTPTEIVRYTHPPVIYDETGNVIPLSKRFPLNETPAPESSPGATFSTVPLADTLEGTFDRMFSPFRRSPELRAAFGQEARRRVAEIETKLRPILRANRTLKSINAERKQRFETLFDEKLSALGSGFWYELEAAQAGDTSVQPILTELLRKVPFTRKDGTKGHFWKGSLMSPAAARRRGIDTSGGEWNDIPEGLPGYIWGGSITPDEAVTTFGFESSAEFWGALSSEIESWRRLKRMEEDAARLMADLRREARAEARAWADQAIRERETVGSDRATLLGFLRTLDAITRALPPEVRGKIGGYVALAQLKTPGAMLGEIERRVEKIDRELDLWLKREADKRRKKLFAKAEPKRESGKKPKGKAGADIHDLFDRLKQSLTWDGDTAEVWAAGLGSKIAAGELTAEEEAHARNEANLVRLFSDWRNADAARRTAAVEAGEHVWKEGYIAEQLRVAKERERRQGLRESLIADTKATGTRSERVRKEIKDAAGVGKMKQGFLSLFNFQQIAGYAFGEGSAVARWFADKQRAAENQRDDEVFAVVESVEDLFRRLADGKALAGEKLQHRLSRPTIDTLEAGPMSELQAITAILMERQEDGRRHLRGKRDDEGKVISSWHYPETFAARLEENLTDEGSAVLDFLTEQYAGEWETLNPIFRELNGIDLPRNDKYAPLTVKSQQAPGGQTTDPTTGTTQSNGSLTPGSLRTRAQVVAEPNFVDAIAQFIAHKRQLAHWKAFAKFNADAQGVLNNREVGNAVEASAGAEALSVLRSWLDVFAQGGVRDAGAHSKLRQTLDRITGRAAAMALVGRVGTLAVQATQLTAAAAKMPFPSYLKRLSLLMAGRLDWSDSLASPYIQRRLKQMPVAVQLAMDGLRATKPNAVKHAARELGKLISGADALFTAGTYAIVLDYQRSQLIRDGFEPLAADQIARQEAERITDEIAQPTRQGARSLFELTNTGPLARMGWAFASESRKNLALMAYSAAKRTPTEAARAVFAFILLNGAMSALIRTAWRDMRDDEDDEIFDEELWNPRRLLLAWSTEWLYGFPVLGDITQDAIFAAAGEWRPDGSLLDAVSKTPRAIARAPETLEQMTEGDFEQALRDLETLLTAAGLASETFAGLASFSHILRDAEALLRNSTN